MSQKKKINLVIDGSCEKCPYCYLDDKYQEYECNHPEVMIIIVKATNLDPIEWSLNWPPIPDNCPLENVNE